MKISKCIYMYIYFLSLLSYVMQFMVAFFDITQYNKSVLNRRVPNVHCPVCYICLFDLTRSLKYMTFR